MRKEQKRYLVKLLNSFAKDSKEYLSLSIFCTSLGLDTEKLISEFASDEDEGTTAFTSASDALNALPAASLLRNVILKNFIRVVDVSNKKQTYYYVDKRRIRLLGTYDAKVDWQTFLAEIRLFSEELCEIGRMFENAVCGYYRKQSGNSVTNSTFSDKLVGAFMSDILSSVKTVSSISVVANPFDADDYGIITLNKEEFIRGYNAGMEGTPLKDNALYNYFTTINNANLHYIESPFNTFCRYLGKVLHRLMGNQVTNYREIFFVRGNGETGTTTLTRALLRRFSDIAVGLDNAFDSPDTHTTSSFVGKFIGIMTECNKRSRIINHPLIRRITTGDVITVNPKFRNPFTATVEMSLILGTNSYPLVNLFKTDEVSRFYIIDTARISPEMRRSDIDKLYDESMDEFLGFCHALYLKFRDKDVGGTLYKPDAMEYIIRSHCESDESFFVRKYYKAVHIKSDKSFKRAYKSIKAVKDDIERIYGVEGIDVDDTIRRMISLPEGHEWKWKSSGQKILGLDGESIETLIRIAGPQTLQKKIDEIIDAETTPDQGEVGQEEGRIKEKGTIYLDLE